MGPGSSWDEEPRAGDAVGAGADPTDEVRLALAELVRSRPAVVADQQRLDGYLRDVCPDRRAEVAVVVAAARAGVPADLSGASHGHAGEALSARLAARLHTEAGIDGALARWAVDAWALALGVGDPTPATPAPEPEDDDLRAMVAPAVLAEEIHTRPPVIEPRPGPPADDVTRPPPAVDPAGRTVGRRPPAPAEPPPGKPDRRPRTGAMVAGGAVVITVALVAVLVAVNREGPGRTTPATSIAAAPPPTAPPTSAAPPTTAAPKLFPTPSTDKPVALTPGAYTTSTLRPRLTATVPDGWQVVTEGGDYLELSLVSDPAQVISVIRPERPLRRDRAFPIGSQALAASATEPKPDDFVAWLGSHGRLSVSPPTPVSRAGARGTQVDVTVKSAYDSDVCRPATCVALFQLDEDSLYYVLQGNLDRVYVLTVGNTQVLVVVEAPADKFQGFAARAAQIVDGITFTG